MIVIRADDDGFRLCHQVSASDKFRLWRYNKYVDEWMVSLIQGETEYNLIEHPISHDAALEMFEQLTRALAAEGGQNYRIAR